MSAKKHRKGWASAAKELEDAYDAQDGLEALAKDRWEKASAYQIAAGRIEILAWDLMGLESEDANKRDAYLGAIWALARLAQKENEV